MFHFRGGYEFMQTIPGGPDPTTAIAGACAGVRPSPLGSALVRRYRANDKGSITSYDYTQF